MGTRPWTYSRQGVFLQIAEHSHTGINMQHKMTITSTHITLLITLCLTLHSTSWICTLDEAGCCSRTWVSCTSYSVVDTVLNGRDAEHRHERYQCRHVRQWRHPRHTLRKHDTNANSKYFTLSQQKLLHNSKTNIFDHSRVPCCKVLQF